MVDQVIADWKHIFKLDPDKPIGDEALEAICLSGTDAVIVGGSSGVTFDNTVDLLARIRRYEVPCVLEATSLEAAVPGFDYYFVPIVLNSDDADYIIGHHRNALKRYGSVIPWDGLLAEGYVILNPDCTAARLSSACAPLDAKDVLAYARFADRLLRLPIVYLEYSGVFGDMKLVSDTRKLLTEAKLFYGGGIDGYEKALAAAAAADTIVVGNIIYESLDRALETVRAVKR
ncbi:heptaprenylglyceryl phosphate synthase [Paenibacillus thermotolerans]|uniref:heptaprenylglyceryl phosphate synthase n=1 Tax=Paenibacillus thermotolerans TaxID=3027807 RepID=UPI0023684BD6|nr:MULTISPECIES: heptaprenylglyceryl phosphate synthase [unclassified Paenibacillus]